MVKYACESCSKALDLPFVHACQHVVCAACSDGRRQEALCRTCAARPVTSNLYATLGLTVGHNTFLLGLLRRDLKPRIDILKRDNPSIYARAMVQRPSNPFQDILPLPLPSTDTGVSTTRGTRRCSLCGCMCFPCYALWAVMRYAFRVLSVVAADVLLCTLAMLVFGVMVGGADWARPGTLDSLTEFFDEHTALVGTFIVLVMGSYLVARHTFGMSPFPRRLRGDVGGTEENTHVH